MELNKLLNPQQLEGATFIDGNLRIIAGAGSGKTRVVTYRIAYLIEDIGIDPRRILAITFTNKAANEMKERIEKVVGIQAHQCTISTIHSFCVRLLRQHINVLNYPGNFVIMDEEDQKALLKKVYQKLNIDLKAIRFKSAINFISANKMSDIDPQKALRLYEGIDSERRKALIYQEYEDYKQKHFMLDFDDLILKATFILENYDYVLSKWQAKYDYIHVDEFQDVGDYEYRLVKLLSKKAVICVVGDPDQTIYSFRGADVNYILDFPHDFAPCKTIYLNENYRSTQNILNASNELIKNNANRLEKELFTKADAGASVISYTAVNEEKEAEYIADQIEGLIHEVEGVNYSDFAILYRANYLSRPIEQALIRRGIDYKIFGGLKFFNRKEIKDALSYLRLLVNQDDLAFERIANVPARGIGQKSLESIQLCALNNQVSEYEAVCFHNQEIKLSSKSKKGLKSMVMALEKARQSTKSLAVIFEELLDDLGYMEMLRGDLEENRIDNIHELQRSIEQYQKDNPETATFENYLQDIALFTDNNAQDAKEFVSLMSIHMAKGLEFNYVFVSGLSEGVFPSYRTISQEGDDGLEEERRLAYVAFTRAKKRLYLTDSEGYNFITNSPKTGSRFIHEIGEGGVERKGIKPRFVVNDLIPKKVVADNNIDWQVGDLLMHDVFGKGVVVKIDGNTVHVAFEANVGIKVLMAGHSALKLLLN